MTKRKGHMINLFFSRAIKPIIIAGVGEKVSVFLE